MVKGKAESGKDRLSSNCLARMTDSNAFRDAARHNRFFLL